MSARTLVLRWRCLSDIKPENLPDFEHILLLVSQTDVCTIHDKKVSVVQIPDLLPRGTRRKCLLEYVEKYFPGNDYWILDDIESFNPEIVAKIGQIFSDSAMTGITGKYKRPFFLSRSEKSFFGEKRSPEQSLLLEGFIVKESALKVIPYHYNSDDDLFDAELLLQMRKGSLTTSFFFVEGKSSAMVHFDSWNFYRRFLYEECRCKIMQYGIFYDFRYKITPKTQHEGTIFSRTYIPKKSKTSVHGWILDQQWKSGSTLLDVGGGQGDAVARPLSERGIQVTLLDAVVKNEKSQNLLKYHADLNQPWQAYLPSAKFDVITALDILEHLYSPEDAAKSLHDYLDKDGILYASTGNIAFCLTRMLLLFGQFNYGTRGILDITHHRLFTVSSYRTLLENGGLKVLKVKGFGPPLADFFPNSRMMRILDRILYFLANLYPRFFAYQIMLVCKKGPDSEELFKTLQ